MPAGYTNPNEEEKREKLPEDYETPFSPPDDIKKYVPEDYPTRDTGMDETEWYQEGDAAASSTEFPKRPHRTRRRPGFNKDNKSS